MDKCEIERLFRSGEILKAYNLISRDPGNLFDLKLVIEKRFAEILEWNRFGKLAGWIEPKDPFEQQKFKLAARELEKLQKKPRVLDVGCFTGWYLRFLYNAGLIESGVGIDIQPETMAKASSISREKNLPLKFIHLNAEEIDQKWKNEFDVVFMFDVLEHVLDDVRVLEAIEKVSKPEALIIINLPIKTEGYIDEALEHVRMYGKDDIIKLFGSKKNFRLRNSKDEHGRKTNFIMYNTGGNKLLNNKEKN